MNTGAAMADHDIHAFTPASPAPQTKRPAAPGAQRRRWPWALLVCLLALAVLAVLGALNIVTLLASAGDGWNVTINGHDVAPFFTGPEHAVTALLAAAAGLFLLLLVVPITVLLVLGVAALAVALAVGCALLVLLLVATVVLSPLWLPALLIWLLLRRRTRPAAPVSAG